MAKTKLRTISALVKKMKSVEEKRILNGRETCDSYVILESYFRNINEQSSSVFQKHIYMQYVFCEGYLHGLFSSHFITLDEFIFLLNEIESSYISYCERAKMSEENEESSENTDLMSIEGGVAL